MRGEVWFCRWLHSSSRTEGDVIIYMYLKNISREREKAAISLPVLKRNFLFIYHFSVQLHVCYLGNCNTDIDIRLHLWSSTKVYFFTSRDTLQ